MPRARSACHAITVFATVLLLTIVVAAPAQGSFPGRNGSIAFRSTAIDQNADGYVYFEEDRVALVAPDGARRMISEGSQAAFSPDGQLLAIAHILVRSSRGIVLHRLDGSDLVRLTSGKDTSPAWSPTGRRLAFTRRTCSPAGCHLDIYTIGRDGAQLRRVVVRGYNPAWSVRGTIAYQTRNGEIWATGPRGKRHWRLAKRGPGENGSNNPDWSPTGDKLVFEREWRDPAIKDYLAEGLFVVNRDGTGLRRIPGPERQNQYVRPSEPVWSPNGRWIAYMDESIYKIHPTGGRAKLIMKDPWWEPDWCPGCDMRYARIYTGSPDWQPLPAEP